jgi:hypothetical protein
VFLQNYQGQWIFFNYRIGTRSHGPGPWSRLMSLRHSRSLSIVDSLIYDSDFIKMKGYWQSNLGRGGGSPEPGVDRVTGHHFRWGLTLWTRHIQRNSPRGSSNGGATGVGRVTTIGLLQPSATSRTSSNSWPTTRLGYTGAARHIEGRHGVGLTRWGLQRSDGELGRRLGFQYLWIKIHHRTVTLYRSFCTES